MLRDKLDYKYDRNYMGIPDCPISYVPQVLTLLVLQTLQYKPLLFCHTFRIFFEQKITVCKFLNRKLH